MAGHFSDAWLDELRSRNEIVQVISGYVQLKQKGGRHWGLCPFHSEKTPSFSVDASKQFYYCFGCHTGGNVIHFIMNIERMSFPEAVEMLAERAGMELPQAGDKARYEENKQRKQRLYDANREAAQFYYQNLYQPGGQKARDYLSSRGLSQKMATHFGLGYSPDRWDGLLKHLTDKGFTLDELVSAGLCMKKESKSFDFFHDRLMFPIIDQRARVLGFGGRILQGEGRKYMNTSDTPIYNKRASLYGVNFYRQFGNSRELVLVEGYMDLLAVAGAGYPNVVATLGTALTEAQTRLLRRFADRVYIAYDGDAAGQNATLRGLELAENDGLDVRVLAFPDGNDPDDFIRNNGSDAFGQAMETADTLIEFRMRMLRGEHDLEGEDGRMHYARKAAALLKGCSPVETERYLRRIADETGFSPDVIRQEIEQQNPTQANTNHDLRNTMSDRKPADAGSVRRERSIVKAMAEDNATLQMVQGQLTREDFSDPLAAELFGIVTAMDTQAELSVGMILTKLDDPEQAAQASGMFETEEATPAAGLERDINEILIGSVERACEQLTRQLAQASGPERTQLVKELAKKQNELTKRKNNRYNVGKR